MLFGQHFLVCFLLLLFLTLLFFVLFSLVIFIKTSAVLGACKVFMSPVMRAFF